MENNGKKEKRGDLGYVNGKKKIGSICGEVVLEKVEGRELIGNSGNIRRGRREREKRMDEGDRGGTKGKDREERGKR